MDGEGNSISLRVGQAGHCHGEAGKTRELSTNSQASLTVDDRRRILQQPDCLLEDGLSVTPRGVILRMGSPPVDSKHVKRVLAWCRKKLGKSTVVLRESETDFVEYSEKWKDPDSGSLFTRIFSWTILFTPFLLHLSSLQQDGRLEGLYLGADWTFRIDFFNFSCWTHIMKLIALNFFAG